MQARHIAGEISGVQTMSIFTEKALALVMAVGVSTISLNTLIV